MSTTSPRLLTADDLWRMPGDQRRELVRGELRMRAPAGYEHGLVVMRLSRLLANHVQAAGLGDVLGAETGFRLLRHPDTVRAPDLAFVRRARVPSERPLAYWIGAPDLAVEVVSPSDALEQIEEKIDDYLAAGTSAVWVVNPRRRSVTIHRAGQNPVVLRQTDTLDGGDLVPGFVCRVAELFS
jgi:Uma2 family endonuclease